MEPQELFDVDTFVDKWGLLDKLWSPDGGDSAQRCGMYWALMGMIPHYEKYRWLIGDDTKATTFWDTMEKIHPSPGVIIRHCNPDYDASDWDRGSRDQYQPNIIAAGYWDRKVLNELRNGHWRRGFLFTNNTRRNGATKRNHKKLVAGELRNYSWKVPDLTGPEIWGNFIRSSRTVWLWPLLAIFDLELLGGAIKWRWFATHNIAMNQCLSQMQAINRMPTPLSWLANKIMPPEKLIDLIEGHFTDFPNDMRFFGPLFRQALKSIRN